MQKIKTQLVVAGAGPAGVCAALAAARRGVETVLISNRPVMGGNSSSEIRVWSRGAVGAGNFYGEEMGIWGEMRLTNLYRNPDGNPIFWDEVLLDTVLKEDRLQLLLNTDVYDLTMDQGKIVSVFAQQQGTEKRFEVEAEAFVDATGDGLLGALSGVPYYIGNEYVSSGEATLSKAPELLCCSLLFYTREEDHAVPFIPPDYAYGIEQIGKLVDRGGRIVNEKMSGSDCWWFEFGGNQNIIENAQEITLELKRLVMGVWNYIKNSGKFQADNYTLEWIGNIPGKRESRRMETEYMLTEQDLLTGTTFSDGAFFGGWYMDTHPSGGMNDTEEENCVQVPVNVYQVPLRCLYNSKVPNLIFAGRIIGTERQAFVSSRVMNTCALSGQAAGELAAMVIREKTAPADLKAEDIEVIRLRLARNDMFIPGAEIQDDGDIAKDAVVDSSSFDDGSCGNANGSFSLEGGGFVAFPAVEGEQVFLKIVAQELTVLRGTWYLSDLPNRLCPGELAGNDQWVVLEGENIIKLKVPANGGGKFCTLEFETAKGVSVLTHERKREGFLCGRKDLPVYYDPVLYYSEDMAFYHPERITEYPDRPWKRPNQWRAAADDLAPWVELQWDAEKPVAQIHLIMDPSLNEELPSSKAKYWQDSHHFVPRMGMPGSLIRSAEIQAKDSHGQWKTVAEIVDNHQRLVKLDLGDRVRASALRLVIRKTWGGAPAVYGLRVYEACV